MAGSLTWLGDGDPEAQAITQNGMMFIKGEKVAVKDKDVFERLSRNPMFSAEADAKAAPADEPTEDEQLARAEAGTERGALKAQLKGMGVSVPGNPSVDTLRAKLAEAHAKANG